MVAEFVRALNAHFIGLCRKVGSGSSRALRSSARTGRQTDGR